MVPTTLSPPWSSAQKIVFRFLFIYFILYTFPFPLRVFSFPWDLNFRNLWNPLVIWTGRNILKLEYEITVLPNGSGDTTWNYVQVFFFFAASALGVLVWSLADRKRVHYEKLFFWLTVLVRYYLAVILIQYGFAKIIKTQFPFPFTNRLFQTYGESSPMGLLWTFMGYSTAYNLFTGICEALAGFLLFFRHTKLLGALLCIAVMSNIVMLNFSYDVPVKLYSLHLLWMSFFLVVPEWRRLLNFFIFNRAAPEVFIEPVFRDSRWRLATLVGKTLFIAFVLVTDVVVGLRIQKQMAGFPGNTNIERIYEVDTYVVNKDTIPPLINDTRRWKRLLVNSNDLVSIEYMDNARIGWLYVSDSLHHRVKVISRDSSTVYHFQYEQNGNHFFLKGVLVNDSLKVTMKKGSAGFPLINRGFHWINEYPFNR